MCAGVSSESSQGSLVSCCRLLLRAAASGPTVCVCLCWMSPFPQGTDPAPHLHPVPHEAPLCPSANICPCPAVSLRLQGTLEVLMHEGPGTVGGKSCLRSVLPPNHPACSCCLKQWSGIKHFNVYLRSSLPENQDSVRLESGQWVQTDWSLKPDSPVQKPSILKKVLTFFELQHLHL